MDVTLHPYTTSKKPLQVEDGEWFTIIKDGDKPGLWGCCDCGLMHRVEFKIIDNDVFIKVERDNEATAIRRDAMYEEQIC